MKRLSGISSVHIIQKSNPFHMVFKRQRRGRRTYSNDFHKTVGKERSFASVNNFDSYMFTLSKYTIFNYIEARHIIPVEIDDVPDVSDTTTPYDEIVANDLKLLVDLTVSEMPPQRKQIFHLSRQEGLTNDEIAVKLGIQKKTVENHLNLALKELRNVIGFIVITYIMLME